MSRNNSALEGDPANPSFGRLLQWHFFVHGTRPDGRPDVPGELWDADKAAHAIGITPRQFSNWLNDLSAPPRCTAIERELFGGSKLYDKERFKLRHALQIARQRLSGRKPSSGQNQNGPEAVSAVALEDEPVEGGNSPKSERLSACSSIANEANSDRRRDDPNDGHQRTRTDQSTSI